MTEATESAHCAANAVCNVLRYLGDVSYAIFPADIAHNLGNLNKSVLSHLRSLIDKDIEWIDARVAGGDRLREEWKRACNHERRSETAEPVN